jgi:predicted TIM-barrel fold metal-dependent hydrolase
MAAYEFHDAHFHLTNYIQEGLPLSQFLDMMGDRVGRATIFGLPVQQQWSYRVDGDRAPTYYLNSDAPLYYYSFTDAHMAMEYRSLPKHQQQRIDPLISGFNPCDMYAVDHIRRVMRTFPGVFSGVGEFSVHKEFVAAKIAGGVASLEDPALDRIFEFAGEVGMLVLIHSDIDVPFAREGSEPAYLERTKGLFRKHPNTPTIWAHAGLGRIVRPIKNHCANMMEILADPALSHVYLDISWDQTAKYIVDSDESLKITLNMLERYPDRFLFGTDAVATIDETNYRKCYEDYAPLWKALSPETSRKIRLGNYERLFDQSRHNIRTWEKAALRSAA